MKKIGQLIKENAYHLIADGMKKHGHTFLVTYTKVSSGKMNDFRKSLKKVGAKVYVSKNRIAQRALKELQYENLAEKIEGQTAFVWTDKDCVEVSRTLVKFTKDCAGIKVKGGLMEGRILEKEDIKRLSDLPSREILLSMLLGTIQSPLTRLAGALSAKTRDLLSILKQLSEQKEKGGK